MTKVLVTEGNLQDIASAIRSKNGSNDSYRPGDMAAAIRAIPTGGTLVSKTITQNGSYDAEDDNADGYSDVTVNVPNSYTAEDEGKVVSSGALVAQTGLSVTQNGTYDTTENNQVVVRVSGGAGNPLLYSIGGFYGTSDGAVASSLSVTTSGYVGDTAVLVVMHRDAITISGWTLIHSQINNPNVLTQYISVYKKVVERSSESYTIIQASSARICACIFYFRNDPQLAYDRLIEPDNVSTFQYTIPTANNNTLVIMSDISAGSARTTVTPTVILHEEGNSVFSDKAVRMLAFVNTSIDPVILKRTSGTSSDSLANNRVHLYTIA